LLVVIAIMLVSWAVLALLARRLPPGLLRDAVASLPACVTAARRLRGNPEAPQRAKIALLVAVLWTLSPIDLLPSKLGRAVQISFPRPGVAAGEALPARR
jgi:hypothetical protein